MATSSIPQGRQTPLPRWPADPFAAMVLKKKGRDPATLALRRLVKNLEMGTISYAVMGGMAVWVHGYRRFADHVEVLVTAEGFQAFRDRFVPRHYESVPGKTRRFIDRVNGVTINLLITGRYPGYRNEGPITFPDPLDVGQRIENVVYVNLTTLIQLKLAAFRPQDYADVVDLIKENQLDESFLTHLHASLHHDYLEGLTYVRREAEYEARGG